MLSKEEATAIVKKNFPSGKIQKCIEYKNLYLFQIFSEDPGEEEWDPFYSVNKDTGEFKDFSILEDGNVKEISKLFLEAERKLS